MVVNVMLGAVDDELLDTDAVTGEIGDELGEGVEPLPVPYGMYGG